MIKALQDWVAIESDSSNVLKRQELHHMMQKAAQKLRLMGGTVELVDIGEQEVSNSRPFINTVYTGFCCYHHNWLVCESRLTPPCVIWLICSPLSKTNIAAVTVLIKGKNNSR